MLVPIEYFKMLYFHVIQAQGAGQVRGTLRNVAPFALKDASGVSIVSQNANEAAIARVISTTTSLTPAQLVVTQQKPGLVGVSTVPQGSDKCLKL